VSRYRPVDQLGNVPPLQDALTAFADSTGRWRSAADGSGTAVNPPFTPAVYRMNRCPRPLITLHLDGDLVGV